MARNVIAEYINTLTKIGITKEIIRYVFISVMALVGLYAIILRFEYPNLTETELFLKMLDNLL